MLVETLLVMTSRSAPALSTPRHRALLLLNLYATVLVLAAIGMTLVFVRNFDVGAPWQQNRFSLVGTSAILALVAAFCFQASARLWVARVDEEAHALVPGSDAVYRFPSKSYGNVEGIAWLSRDTLVAVSDRKKRGQPARCAEKDQSIHLFRIPAG